MTYSFSLPILDQYLFQQDGWIKHFDILTQTRLQPQTFRQHFECLINTRTTFPPLSATLPDFKIQVVLALFITRNIKCEETLCSGFLLFGHRQLLPVNFWLDYAGSPTAPLVLCLITSARRQIQVHPCHFTWYLLPLPSVYSFELNYRNRGFCRSKIMVTSQWLFLFGAIWIK
jgi:hypothetical protein